MGVRVLATSLAQQAGTFEPQRTHNWTLEVVGINAVTALSDRISLSLHEGFSPTHGSEELEVPFGNERVYVAGRAQYEQGTLRLKDWVDQDVAAAMSSWRELVHNPLTGQIGLARNYKATGSIVLFGPDSIDGTGSFERVWQLIGLWPVSVHFGDLAMTASDQVYLTSTLRYDKAIRLFGGPIVSPPPQG